MFQSQYRPNIDVDYDSNDDQGSDFPAASDLNIDKSHGLTDKELQMFRKLFSYRNFEELEQALIRADTKKI